jgi:hypothetical protein
MRIFGGERDQMVSLGVGHLHSPVAPRSPQTVFAPDDRRGHAKPIWLLSLLPTAPLGIGLLWLLLSWWGHGFAGGISHGNASWNPRSGYSEFYNPKDPASSLRAYRDVNGYQQDPTSATSGIALAILFSTVLSFLLYAVIYSAIRKSRAEAEERERLAGTPLRR